MNFESVTSSEVASSIAEIAAFRAATTVSTTTGRFLSVNLRNRANSARRSNSDMRPFLSIFACGEYLKVRSPGELGRAIRRLVVRLQRCVPVAGTNSSPHVVRLRHDFVKLGASDATIRRQSLETGSFDLNRGFDSKSLRLDRVDLAQVGVRWQSNR